MKKLVKLTEKMRLQAENKGDYGLIYSKLCEAIDVAERQKLIRYQPETKKE